MTTVTVPNELLTVEEWDAIEETDANRLDAQPPDGLVALQHIGVTIEAQFPPTERCPDVVMFPRAQAHLNVPRIDPAAVDDGRFVAYELVGGTYKEVARGSGVITLERPFPVSVDVDALLTFD
ncbi:hypothetical protein E1212_11430 [Jiangella ureilytica]|uniref:Uncharacterized protein n=1 Tax=Jiangella ureilytica TaxID=2530374 RepID=A0A4R4RS65_9ACTN|nr:hypothetical protein [Jiangella ureilytica]TDC51602.1 hypothetical protein E1212_11430 [Jiangella ureilytica]